MLRVAIQGTAGLFLCVPLLAFAAATDLPDISVVGDLTAQMSSEGDYPGRNRVTIREIEVALQDYVYPDIRADVFLAMHRAGDVFESELCEASVSFLHAGIDGMGLQVGKVHIDFGKLNKVHQHERPFADQPLVIDNFFGPHGLVGEGASLGYLFPLPFFLRLDTGAWWISPGQHHHEDEEEHAEFSLAGRAYTARVWTGFCPDETAELELGATGAFGKGPHYLEHKDDVRLAGCDLTLKVWHSSYRRLILQSEFLYLNRRLPVGILERHGLYTYLGYDLNRYWGAAVRYDRTENAAPTKKVTSLVSAIGTYRLTETTRLRLQLGVAPEDGARHATMQLVFGLGPHSHPLQ